MTVAVRALSSIESDDQSTALADILIDCVEGGASIGFLSPLARQRADAFWRGVAEDLERGGRILLIAEDSLTATVVGTVQVVFARQENQPHRADLSKMLVPRCARRRGIGAMLMRAAEDAARAAGKTLLVLDTATDDAARLYERLGWTRVGTVPSYALLPDGRPCPTIYYYKSLD